MRLVQLSIIKAIARSPRKALAIDKIAKAVGRTPLELNSAVSVMLNEFDLLGRNKEMEYFLTARGKYYLAKNGRLPNPGGRGYPLKVSAADTARLRKAVRSGCMAKRVLIALELTNGTKGVEVARKLNTPKSRVSRIKNMLRRGGVDLILRPYANSMRLFARPRADIHMLLDDLSAVRETLRKIEAKVSAIVASKIPRS